ncbi:hypothetical protein [Phascolarctobacterium sp.]|uniref:hypothetical protein n=1 Tax=Phascolarctobacterium sp. TaxID=2049039 RepID=UPI0026DCBA6A|nr:hypothetical protein [Phascolarctobacterium sp.]
MFDRFPELKIAYELKEYYINMNSTTLLSDAPEALDRAIVLLRVAALMSTKNSTDCSITGARR